MMAWRKLAAARGRAAARSTKSCVTAIKCTTKSCRSIVAFVLILLSDDATRMNTKIDIKIILLINRYTNNNQKLNAKCNLNLRIHMHITNHVKCCATADL